MLQYFFGQVQIIPAPNNSGLRAELQTSHERNSGGSGEFFASLRWFGAQEIIRASAFDVEVAEFFVEVFPRVWHHLAHLAASATLSQAAEINVECALPFLGARRWGNRCFESQCSLKFGKPPLIAPD